MLLQEHIHVPVAIEIYGIIESCLETTTYRDEFFAKLQHQIERFLNQFLSGEPGKTRNLEVRFHAPTQRHPGGAVFRCDPTPEEDDPELPKSNNPNITIFMDDYQENHVFDRTSYDHERSIKRLGRIVTHELVHVIQFFRSGEKNISHSMYTVGIKRPKDKETGKRYGKRREYVRTGRAYLGNAIEIDAHAADAAAEIIHRVMKESKDRQVAYLMKVVRSLQEMSDSLSAYKDNFKRPELTFMFRRGPGAGRARDREQRQRKLVWKRYRQKLAAHLMDYVDRIG